MAERRARPCEREAKDDAKARLEEARRKAEEALRARWAERTEEEPVFRYVVEFECAPSVFENIKQHIGTMRTFNRSFRFYVASRDGKGTVIKDG